MCVSTFSLSPVKPLALEGCVLGLCFIFASSLIDFAMTFYVNIYVNKKAIKTTYIPYDSVYIWDINNI